MQILMKFVEHSQLSEAAGEEIVREELVSAFTLLLKDQEAEVRTAAAGQIPGEFSLFSMVD